MRVPVQVSFRDMPVSDAVEARIRQEADWLERYCDWITSCRVWVSAPARHGAKGGLYSVRVDLTLPGGEVLVTKGRHHGDHSHEDVFVAIRDAFHAARRRVEDFARRHRERSGRRSVPLRGRICDLHEHEGYGFIRTADSREVYFGRDDVVDGPFRDLAIGSEVGFVEQSGEGGVNAASVRLIGERPHQVV